MRSDRLLPQGPVILVHLELHGRNVCSDTPYFPPTSDWPDVPRVLCAGCRLAGVNRPDPRELKLHIP